MAASESLSRSGFGAIPRKKIASNLAGRDRSRLCDLGIATVHESACWRTLETRPGRYDFSELARVCDAAAHTPHSEVILDLLNLEWPDYLDVTRREFVDAFADFAEATVDFLARRARHNITIIPVHQISFLSWAAGDLALVPPYLQSMGGLVRRQLVKAAIRASKVIRAKLPAASLLSVEPLIHSVLNPSVPANLALPERRRRAMFEPWDMLTGKACPELGGRPEYLNIICVRFFERHPWFDSQRLDSQPQSRRLEDDGQQPFHRTLVEIHQRYGLPVLVTRAPSDGHDASAWSRYIDQELAAALHLGVPIVGVSFHPDDKGFRSLAAALDHEHTRSVASTPARKT
jgi:hypothetical protein